MTLGSRYFWILELTSEQQVRDTTTHAGQEMVVVVEQLPSVTYYIHYYITQSPRKTGPPVAGRDGGC